MSPTEVVSDDASSKYSPSCAAFEFVAALVDLPCLASFRLSIARALIRAAKLFCATSRSVGGPRG